MVAGAPQILTSETVAKTPGSGHLDHVLVDWRRLSAAADLLDWTQLRPLTFFDKATSSSNGGDGDGGRPLAGYAAEAGPILSRRDARQPPSAIAS